MSMSTRLHVSRSHVCAKSSKPCSVQDLQLQVGSILISGQQAAFRMGSPDQPLQHGARIVMTGTAWTNTGSSHLMLKPHQTLPVAQ